MATNAPANSFEPEYSPTISAQTSPTEASPAVESVDTVPTICNAATARPTKQAKHGSVSLEAPAPLNGKVYPPGSLGYVDRMTLSKGLFAHYGVHEATDPHSYNVGKIPHFPFEGTEVDRAYFVRWALEQVLTNKELATAKTILVLSDTNALESIEHWEHTSRVLLDRVQWVGPHQEDWFLLFLPIPPKISHFVWAGVYALQALAMLLPDTNLYMWDHDATPSCLWETPELLAFAKNTQLPYRFDPAHYGMIAISESNSHINAGIVGFPALPVDSDDPVLQSALNDARNLAVSWKTIKGGADENLTKKTAIILVHSRPFNLPLGNTPCQPTLCPAISPTHQTHPGTNSTFTITCRTLKMCQKQAPNMPNKLQESSGPRNTCSPPSTTPHSTEVWH